VANERSIDLQRWIEPIREAWVELEFLNKALIPLKANELESLLS
jgi:hypothetical protein